MVQYMCFLLHTSLVNLFHSHRNIHSLAFCSYSIKDVRKIINGTFSCLCLYKPEYCTA